MTQSSKCLLAFLCRPSTDPALDAEQCNYYLLVMSSSYGILLGFKPALTSTDFNTCIHSSSAHALTM